MFSSLGYTIERHFDFYVKYAYDTWRHITPIQYASLLIAIATVGWIMMKSSR